MTLDTGHARRSPRSEVEDTTIEKPWPDLTQALDEGVIPLPGYDDCCFYATKHGRGMSDVRRYRPGRLADRDLRRDAAHARGGDIDHDGVAGIAGWITPVPGGGGPVTVAILMRNTIIALKRRKAAPPHGERRGGPDGDGRASAGTTPP